jgi:hypothetical protein
VTLYQRDLIAGLLPFTIDDVFAGNSKEGIWFAGVNPALRVTLMCWLSYLKATLTVQIV